MKMNKKFSKSVTLLLLGLTVAPAVIGGAKYFSSAEKVHAQEEYRVKNGTATVKPDGSKQTDGKIILNGAKEDQSIKNKQFMFYKIFNVVNAEHNESVNYTWNEKYKAITQKVIFDALTDSYKTSNKINTPADVSEYAAIDYMQSLNNNRVEGALTEQKREGRYSDFRYFVEDLKNAIRKSGVEGDKFVVDSPDEHNRMTVEGLSWGYYFVDEISTGDDVTNGQPGRTEDGRVTDGIHYASSLVLVNTVNKVAELTLKSDYPSIIKKIQEDDWNDKRNDHDKIGNEGWNDIGDYQIGQTIPYANDIRIPDMNGYHGYYFTIEDRMDKELTFHADKNNIKLVISKKGSDKKYTVQANEYNLHTVGTNVSKEVKEGKYPDNFDSTATFELEFEDLKAIVDREFPDFGHTAETQNATHNKHENNYDGLSMHVEYEATLNDLAAEKTGRPGFENDVRLIFSNDPDSTGGGKRKPGIPSVPPPDTPPGRQPKGKTPWDTVVAFTYRLNGNKVNTNNFSLKGAKFRIYEDEAMTKEIKVKKKPTTTTVKTKSQPDPHMLQGVQPVEGSFDGVDGSNKTKALDDNGKVIEPNAGKTTNLQSENDSPTKGVNEYIIIDKDSDTGAPSDPIESDEDGNFSIVGLDSDVYYIKEVEAPIGYRLLKDPIKVDVKATFTDKRNEYIKGDGATDKTLKALAAKANMTEFYHQIFKTGSADLHTKVENGIMEMKVVNETNEKLPVTGGQMIAILLALGAGVVTFTVYGVSKKVDVNEDQI